MTSGSLSIELGDDPRLALLELDQLVHADPRPARRRDLLPAPQPVLLDGPLDVSDEGGVGDQFLLFLKAGDEPLSLRLRTRPELL